MQDHALALSIAALKVAPIYVATVVVVGRLFARWIAGAMVRR